MVDPVTFRLGIIGGCMSHQVGIAMSDLYHRRFADAIEASSGVRVRVHVARAFGSDYVTRLDTLLNRHQVDGVLLHLRVTIYRRSRVFFSQVIDGRRRHFLNPVLLDRRHGGPRAIQLRSRETAGRVASRRAGDRLAKRVARHERRRRRGARARMGFGRLNWTLGAIVGLDRWAVDDEILALKAFVGACAARSLPVFVLGPTPLARRPWKDRVPRMLTERLRLYAAQSGVGVALIDGIADPDGLALVKPDGMHLTPEGHAFVAQRLQDAGMPAWVSAIVKETQA